MRIQITQLEEPKLSTKENEIQLIHSFKNGNQLAFEQLFHKYHKKLYGFLYSLIGVHADAEEIVQDTFVKIWEKRSDYVEGYSFEGFLFKVAKNTFLNQNRKKVNRKIFEDYYRVFNSGVTNNTEEYMLYNETKKLIDTITEEMPPKRKEIFLLQKIDGLSRKEIAKKLDISVSTVDGQLLKANNYFKDELKKYSLLFLILVFSYTDGTQLC